MTIPLFDFFPDEFSISCFFVISLVGLFSRWFFWVSLLFFLQSDSRDAHKSSYTGFSAFFFLIMCFFFDEAVACVSNFLGVLQENAGKIVEAGLSCS
jgi:hypothetical protein